MYLIITTRTIFTVTHLQYSIESRISTPNAEKAYIHSNS